jgi:hypothetical protein
MKRVLVVLCLTIGVAFQALGGAASAASWAVEEHRLLVSSHGVSAAVTNWAWCEGGDNCFPLPAAPTSLLAHGGGHVRIVTDARVESISVGVARPTGVGGAWLRVFPADTSGRNFVVGLPPGPPLPLLVISTEYSGVPESGVAKFTINLVEHRHERARPKQVTARPTARCGRPSGGRRSCRLDQRGRIEPPAGAAADCRGGRMLVRLTANGRTVLRARARTSAACRYRLRGRRFSLPLGAKRVVVRTRFLGSSSLTARQARSVGVRPTFR